MTRRASASRLRVVHRTKTAVDHAELRKQRARAADGPELIDQPTVVHDADTDQPVLAYLPVPEGIDFTQLMRVCDQVPYVSDRVKRANGMFQRAMTFGYRPRLPVYGYAGCSTSRMNAEWPELAAPLMAAAEVVEPYYREHGPEAYAHHQQQVAQIDPAWRMGNADGMFTQGIVNHTFSLLYHTDGGNFPGCWSAMLVMRNHTEGGHLVIPEYGLRLACAHGTVALFDGQALIHGNTPIRPTGPDPRRFSVVFYALRAMCHCLPPADEVVHAQQARTATERKMHSEPEPDLPEPASLQWDRDDTLVVIPSRGRPHLVPAMTHLLHGVPHVWLVDRGEASAYTEQGAESVVSATPYSWVPEKRNMAIALAQQWGARWCVMLDDDVKRFGAPYLNTDGKPRLRNLVGAEAVQQLVATAEAEGAGFAACYDVWNAGWAHKRPAIERNKLLVTAACVVDTQRPERFDESLPVRSDYDLALQHMTTAGTAAVRVNHLVVDHNYGTEPGGCQDYRSPELIEATNARLLERWPEHLAPNSRRPGELRQIHRRR